MTLILPLVAPHYLPARLIWCCRSLRVGTFYPPWTSSWVSNFIPSQSRFEDSVPTASNQVFMVRPSVPLPKSDRLGKWVNRWSRSIRHQLERHSEDRELSYIIPNDFTMDNSGAEAPHTESTNEGSNVVYEEIDEVVLHREKSHVENANQETKDPSFIKADNLHGDQLSVGRPQMPLPLSDKLCKRVYCWDKSCRHQEEEYPENRELSYSSANAFAVNNSGTEEPYTEPIKVGAKVIHEDVDEVIVTSSESELSHIDIAKHLTRESPFIKVDNSQPELTATVGLNTKENPPVQENSLHPRKDFQNHEHSDDENMSKETILSIYLKHSDDAPSAEERGETC
ncbi:hypothetical protein SK128_018861 [Halocaridina rubra]|uniref:Uncharacterized protein n=1 Tax=Halocaridina rubra TaxID=373956 RepID=A0AAN8XEV7_HALRR